MVNMSFWSCLWVDQYSPTLFIELMDGVFRPYLDSFFIVFTDNILIYSCNKEDHERHLRIALQTRKMSDYMPCFQSESSG